MTIQRSAVSVVEVRNAGSVAGNCDIIFEESDWSNAGATFAKADILTHAIRASIFAALPSFHFCTEFD